MKRNNLISVVFIIFITIILVSCNVSVKGKWSESDKLKFQKETERVTQLSNLGADKTIFIECFLRKCEANYSSFEEANNDKNGSKKIALECSFEVFSNGSVKGKWSESDIQKFRKVIGDTKEILNLGENKTRWIECYLRKCETNYSSFFEANIDGEGCEKIALECNEEVLSNGSVTGKWSESDKQNLRNKLESVKELSNLGSKKAKWIKCFQRKCEAIYSSYYKANNDEKGLAEIALVCNEEVK